MNSSHFILINDTLYDILIKWHYFQLTHWDLKDMADIL